MCNEFGELIKALKSGHKYYALVMREESECDVAYKLLHLYHIGCGISVYPLEASTLDEAKTVLYRSLRDMFRGIDNLRAAVIVGAKSVKIQAEKISFFDMQKFDCEVKDEEDSER